MGLQALSSICLVLFQLTIERFSPNVQETCRSRFIAIGVIERCLDDLFFDLIHSRGQLNLNTYCPSLARRRRSFKTRVSIGFGGTPADGLWQVLKLDLAA